MPQWLGQEFRLELIHLNIKLAGLGLVIWFGPDRIIGSLNDYAFFILDLNLIY